MTTPRSALVDPVTPLFYHLVSRCVRRSWLCGKDPTSGRDFTHRKSWLIQRLQQLACCFSVDIAAWAVMDNHFHLVVYFDPLACQRWSAEDVVRRWLEAFPPRCKGVVDGDRKELIRQELLSNPHLIEARRRKLGSLSTFMKHLKQPIAVRANQEDGCHGHFFESRFYSGALLTEEAVIASMAYVDLNPVRANIARSLEECHDTSIEVRLAHLANSADRLQEAIGSLFSGIGEIVPRVSISIGNYVAVLRSVIHNHLQPLTNLQGQADCWPARVRVIGKQRRVYGSDTAIEHWCKIRGWRPLGGTLP